MTYLFMVFSFGPESPVSRPRNYTLEPFGEAEKLGQRDERITPLPDLREVPRKVLKVRTFRSGPSSGRPGRSLPSTGPRTVVDGRAVGVGVGTGRCVSRVRGQRL